ncbi:MAG TPA: hypothetical protein VIX73_04025 [Kofleriaceae bacterium]|jgi:hypothetical protein
MHRAALPAIGILCLAGVAAAEPWTVRMETGGEADSNIARVETTPTSPRRIAAGAGRLGARITHRGALFGGGYSVDVSGLARMIASSNDALDDENVALATGEASWLHAVGDRPIAFGVHATAADSVGIMGGVGARTFRNLGGDAMVVVGRGDDHHLTLGVGGRDFVYKPVLPEGDPHMFNWRGPVANAQLNAMLYQTSDRTENLELAASFGFEQRAYASTAISNCAPDVPVRDPCSAPTALHRRDRYQRAGLAVTWTGGVVATGNYQATVIDSNSYGQSLIRQRITAQVTLELFSKLLATAAATLQIDQYPDGIPVQTSVQHLETTNLEDENRSSLQILLARPVSAAWSVEARGALWRDFASTAAATFRRTLIYAGVVYAH